MRRALVLLLLAAPLSAIPKEPDAAALVAAAEKARRQGDSTAARGFYEKALSANPRHGRAALGLSEMLIEERQFEAAVGLLTRLMRDLPERAEPRRALALALLSVGRREEALIQASKAVELDPENPDGNLCLGIVLAASRQNARAVEAFQKALARRPNDLSALHGLAKAYGELLDPRAEETFQRLLRLAPRNPASRVDHARYLWQAGMADGGNEALLERGNREMERVLGEKPGEAKLRTLYGVSLVDQRRYVKAVEELERALATGPADYETLVFLGGALKALGRFDDAATRYRAAVRTAPDRIAARVALGRLLLLSGRAEEAAAELAKAETSEPGSASIQLDLGRALEAAGRPEQALTAYHRAIEIEPELAPARYSLGTLLARRGKGEEAKEHLALYRRHYEQDQEKKLGMGLRRGKFNLGWVELKAGRPERALPYFEGYPGNTEALRGAAAALSRLGRREEAIRALERAAALVPDDHRLRYELDIEYARAREK